MERKLNSLQAQQRMERLLEERVLPKLEVLFDQMAGPNQWIEIDRLDIDFGQLRVDQLDEEWTNTLLGTIKEALAQRVFSPTTIPKSLEQISQAWLAYFLDHGHLPWWMNDIDLETHAQTYVQQRPAQVLHLLDSPVRIKRWTLQFSPSLQQELLKHTGITPPISFGTWQSLGLNVPSRKSSLWYWQAVWECAGKESFRAEDFVKELIKKYIRLLESPSERKNFLEKLQSTSLNVETSIYEELMFPEQTEKLVEDLHDENSDWPNNNFKGKFTEEKTENFTKGAQEILIHPSAEIYVPLAGIVLLHPFLPAFLGNLKLVNDDQFLNEEVQAYAVHLVYYLATEKMHPDESELVLPKLLCGWPLDKPIEKFLDLQKEHLQECENLLDALIANWPAVEGIDHDYLRQTFFQREGKLEPHDYGQKLTVTPEALDIIMHSLTWGLSPIHFSWMPQMLWVEWGT